MKDKKIIYGAVAAIVIIVLLVIIVVVTSKGSSKNPYGFKSEYTESTLEENQLRNFLPFFYEKYWWMNFLINF